MKYVVKCGVNPDVGHRVTFVELGYQFAKLGGELVVSENPDTLQTWFMEGIKQHKHYETKIFTVKEECVSDTRILEHLPGLNPDHPYWIKYRREYQQAYLLLSQGVDKVYGWFGEKFCPLRDLASGMGIAVTDLSNKETLRHAEDYALNKSLQF